ncbi:hypothetical protein BFJ63_vAg13112 [Fusarium oxysporum f. sp. narcissi]|uniref:Transcription factor domain-containing protein n=1 Tax=Fusarium oxysporum f. sp. narcissi TaxID=451672 RepID=A0A4Q2V9F0_FUSOX|nr:hypothetical protein BFJ63_vAg13112 [Fusarium oxysporum f. sp. narcissi]
MHGGINGEVTQPGPEVALNPMPMDFLNFGLLGETSSHTGFGPSRESSWCYPSTAWQKYPHGEPPADTPSHGNLSDGEDAFRQSLWSWTPREGDHWRSQTAELIPCLDDLLSDYIAQSPQTYACIPILASTRHRLVSMMLTVSGEGNYERIMATFPSLATLNYLLSKDLQCRSMELHSWIHMARRAGFFQLGPFDGPLPRVDDSSDTLEMKWQTLGIHILNVCTQFSLALVMTPLVKYTEMSVPLPAARSLWDASSAEAWRSAYLALENQSLASLPQLRTCYSNFATLLHLGDALDAPSAGLAILSGLWMNVWQYKERVKARNTSTETLHTNTNSALIIQSLQHEARGVLEDFKSVYTQLTGTMEPNLLALHEQQLMHLYISLEDVQYLGGKAGEVEARRVLPLLTRWVKGRASRQAAWHAGQILRVSRQELGPTLRASIIIALYHASLTLWVYSILSDVPSVDMPIATSQRQLHQNRDHCAGREPLALVDGEDTPVVQRFLLVPGAIAAITPSVEDMQPIVLHISHASAVMTAIATLLRDRSELNAYWDCPSLVDNLTRLVERLGRTAERVYR